VPPLRDRPGDIPALAGEFARFYGEKFGMGPLSLTPELIEAMVREPWPGNVRQLENTLARLAALSTGGTITLADYRDHVAPEPHAPSAPVSGPPAPAIADDEAGDADAGDFASGPSLREQVEAFERSIVNRALDACGGNQSEAARRLRISRVTLIDKMKKYGLTSRRS